jgi:hypothetical protein
LHQSIIPINNQLIMIKKILPFVVIVAGVSCNAHACPIKMDSDTDLSQIVKRNGGFPIDDDVCAELNRRNLAVSYDGAATVLAGVDIGWAAVEVRNIKTGVVSEQVGTGTQVRTGNPSQDVAEQQFMLALKSASQSLNWQRAIQETSSN